MLLQFSDLHTLSPEPEVRYQHTLLPLFAAILYQRVLVFSFSELVPFRP